MKRVIKVKPCLLTSQFTRPSWQEVLPNHQGSAGHFRSTDPTSCAAFRWRTLRPEEGRPLPVEVAHYLRAKLAAQKPCNTHFWKEGSTGGPGLVLFSRCSPMSPLGPQVSGDQRT